MEREDAKRTWLRLREKGGKRHEVPCHHNLAAYLDAWIEAAGIAADKKGPLFRAIRKGNKLTENPMARSDVLVMIKRRAAAAALPYSTCCHTFRATGITTYMQNGAHSSMRSRSPRMSRRARPNYMIAPKIRFRWTGSSGLESEPTFVQLSNDLTQ
jgi:integrase